MFTKMTVSFRLFVYFSIGAALLLMLAAFSIVELRSINAIAAKEQRAATRGRLAGELANAISEFRVREATDLLAKDPNSIAKVQADMAARIDANEDLRSDYRPLIGSDTERHLFDTLGQTWKSYAARHADFLALARSDKPAAADFYLGPLNEDYRATDAAADALGRYSIENTQAERERAQHITDAALRILTAISLVTVIMAGILLLLIRSQVGRPLTAITHALSTVASGNFSVEVPGHERHDEIGTLARALEVFLRTAQQLDQAHRDAEEAHRQMQTLARHDVLTGLPNRRMLWEEMRKSLARVSRSGGMCAIMVIDLDRFKPVNDVYGHVTGDSVLFEVAKRLNEVLRKGDTLARLGGDEFAVVAEFAVDTDGPMRLATRLIRAASESVSVEGASIDVGATIGVALAPADGMDPDSLLRAADIAMYRGKREGRGCFRFFEESMELELRSRVNLESELRAGIAAGEIVPYYQPIVSLADQSLLGFEILARWQHPQKGELLPSIFIPIAEETGMMPELTYRILRIACRDARYWPAYLTLSLNISPSQLKDTQFAVHLLSILVEEGFPPERLEVEMTEDALVADLDQARAILKSLQNIGIHIALDDFGTGYSSLYHLRELHFDRIKIDRSFIQSIFENRENAEIVGAIIGIGKSLGLPTTAEGIEDLQHMRKLAELGCENGQGFYFGRPMGVAEAAKMVKAARRSEPGAANAKGLRATAS